ncbi:benzoylformate decarboxylase [Enemella evansiae]|uniref:benzoylformate decarboxylase n=1 Tax=Enemella evansiae TaxID=2016499 RepID=UPI000B96E5F5|nr:benzoylformate decarboxylase [Enemella evansiae]OYO00125.1 benzoylformate decarboxylase [Enemella evansiae]
MKTVREITHDLLLARGVRTIFGNPGSNELPFLTGLPDQLDYVLALHEGAALGMADGYAQVTDEPVVVNLHAASGTGNAMGALTNAAQSGSPLVLIAGQQVRGTIGLDVMLANLDSTQLTRPLTRWSYEPACAEDVPRAVSEAVLRAVTAPGGPTYLSVPYDDWDREATADDSRLPQRVAPGTPRLAEETVAAIAARIDAAERFALVLGARTDTTEGWAASRALAEAVDADVWVAPSASRMPFPNRHGQFRGVLPAAISGVSEALAPYDLVLVAGAPLFRYHQYAPGRYLGDGVDLVHLTDNPDEAARAPFGESQLGDPVAALAAIAQRVRPRPNERREQWQPVGEVPAETPETRKLSPEAAFAVLRDTAPADTCWVVESTSTNSAFWSQMDLRQPRSYLWPSAGGLGFGLPAAVGAKLGQPDRPVVAVVGDGSVNYTPSALWTAAQRRLPMVFVVLNNGGYGALRWFADVLGIDDAPGLDVPGIDFVALARGYGLTASAVGSVGDFEAAFRTALAADGPTLIEVATAPSTP